MASILTDENISIVNNLDSFRVAAVGALSDIRLIVVIPAMAFCVSGIAVGAVFVAVDQTGVMRVQREVPWLLWIDLHNPLSRA